MAESMEKMPLRRAQLRTKRYQKNLHKLLVGFQLSGKSSLFTVKKASESCDLDVMTYSCINTCASQVLPFQQT